MGLHPEISHTELLGNYNKDTPLNDLWFIIPYQTVRIQKCWRRTEDIIPYQELLGNYNAAAANQNEISIIPYQELLGNYNILGKREGVTLLYHTKNC